jgi:transposase
MSMTSRSSIQVPQAIMVRRDTPSMRHSKHLCADAGCQGRRALEIIESHGHIPHVVSRQTEADAKRRNPTRKAGRWVVEVCHSWFNRFRKPLVRYEKLERSFVTLNHIAAAIIAFRKVKLKINIIYGYVLRPSSLFEVGQVPRPLVVAPPKIVT